ncbi:hypothetical protein IMZ31_01080 [Pontibacillus sp. ALD_SL1]|uniref:sunset domain-containing protein n=1 Tax=Pontibacillus sp. ALD_SL1 TaxID=2777185 RepID=UPI001A9791CF|nr:hypothetical protein [Pontibacillus sp. ALD_SL1]QST00243.1 hypothetical protein IMZ31_01080 [Pontibacillus sp. ALD_SL1]
MRKFGVVLVYLAVFASGMMFALLFFTPSQRKARIRSTPHTVQAPTIQTEPSHKETELVEFAEEEEFKSLEEKDELVEASSEQRDPFEETRESIRDEMRSVVEMSDIGRSLNPQPIKGNQNAKGEKIYHMPGGQYYSRVKAIEVFETPSEAEAAGYRKSRR